MFSKKIAFVASLVSLIASSVWAIYEKDKGRNEWHIETLGELEDLIFIGDDQAYTLSTDHLLTLFDVNSQSIVWKKQMAASDSEYKLRHIGRNLIIYSNDRVAMVNSVGHVIFEVPLLGESASALEIFQEKGGDIFTVMVRDRLVTVYNGYVSVGSFLVEAEESQFKPLEVFYSTAHGIVLVAQVGQIDGKAKLATFALDYKTVSSRMIGWTSVDEF